jgi:hypothetical protein
MGPSKPTWKIKAWSVERPLTTHPAFSAAEAYDLALDKYVYASFQILIISPDGQEITLDELRGLADAEGTTSPLPEQGD